MRRPFIGRNARWQWVWPGGRAPIVLHPRGIAAGGFGQTEIGLPAADQFQIDIGQDFGIEQRAVKLTT